MFVLFVLLGVSDDELFLSLLDLLGNLKQGSVFAGRGAGGITHRSQTGLHPSPPVTYGTARELGYVESTHSI